MIDFRALCAELHAAFTTYAVDECHHNLLERARAALADEPASVVTDDELDNMANEAGLDLAWRPELRRFARFILASGAAAILQPIPVSKELPWELDCDAEGRCWWGRSESNDRFADWTLATHEAVAEFCEFSPQTVWLPAHALPLPTAND